MVLIIYVKLKTKEWRCVSSTYSRRPNYKNKYYEVSYVTPTAKSRYFYDIRDNGEYIIVTYAEEGEAEGKLNNWFHKLQVKIREKQISNRISLTLRNIEQEIKKNK